MTTLLAVTWDGGGNVPPLLGIAAEMARRGHDVRVLGHERQRGAVTAAGLDFVPFRHARPWDPAAPAPGPRFLAGYVALFTDPGPGRDVEEGLRERPADLVLVDALCLGAVRAAVRSGARTAVLVHLFREFLLRGWARGPIGVLGALRGMRPGRVWGAADRVLVACDPGLDPGARRALPASVRYTGVVAPRVAPAPGRDVRSGERPLVLVSLSTIWFPGQQETLQAVLDGLDGLPVRVLATVGEGIDVGALRVPDGIEVRRPVPHTEVMPSAALVIGHGGHATTMLALAHDLPVLVLPMHPRLDQPMVGAAVADAGAGRVLPRSASPAAIREAVCELLLDGPHRAAAAAVGARLRARDGAVTAADELEAMRWLRPVSTDPRHTAE